MGEETSDVHHQLLRLCKRALDARLPYAEIFAELGSSLDGIPFYEDVFLDLRFAVEHVPAKGFSREVNLDEWYASEMHDTLVLDIRLMQSGLAPAEMATIRNSLVERTRFTRETVDSRIAEAVARKR